MDSIVNIIECMIYIFKNSPDNETVNFELGELNINPKETPSVYSNITLFISGLGYVVKIINATQRRQEYKMEILRGDSEIRLYNVSRYTKILVKHSYEDDEKLAVAKIDSNTFKEQMFMAAMSYDQLTYNKLEMGYKLLRLLEDHYEITIMDKLLTKSQEELEKMHLLLKKYIDDNLNYGEVR